MINKVLMIVILCIALYVHNLGMFFGMIVAYIFGMMSMVDGAMKYLKKSEEVLTKVEGIIAKEKNNG